jgi:hypothetical protein
MKGVPQVLPYGLVVLAVAVTATAAGGAEDELGPRWSVEMQKGVHLVEGLSSNQKQTLCRVVAEAAAEWPDNADDKALHAREHLRAFLPSLLPDVDHPSDEMVALVAEEFGWAVGNYARLPALTSEERRRGEACAERVFRLVQEEVAAGYPAVPDDVKASILAAVRRAHNEGVMPHVGTYFQIGYLYPEAEDVSERALRGRFLQEYDRTALSLGMPTGLDLRRGQTAEPGEGSLAAALFQRNIGDQAADESKRLVIAMHSVLTGLYTRKPARGFYEQQPGTVEVNRRELQRLTKEGLARESAELRRQDAEAAQRAGEIARGFDEAAAELQQSGSELNRAQAP